MGKEFYVGVLPTYRGGIPAVRLVISSESAGEVTIQAASLGLNKTVSLFNNAHTEHLGAPIVQVQNATVSDKSVKITSTVDISVMLVTTGANMYEEVLILPTKCLSTRYIVSSYYPNPSGGDLRSNFLVIGTQDNTVVHVAARVGNTSTSNFSFVIGYGQSYLYNNVKDLTGTSITSDHPIAVFSGHEAVVGSNGEEYIAQELIPSSMYGSVFLVPTLYPRTKYFIRIVSSEPDTVVTYRLSNETTASVVTFNTSGDFAEILADRPVVVLSDKPIVLTKYNISHQGSGDLIKDPFLTNGSLPAAPRCFSCKDMAHLYLCDTIATCTEGQNCFVERYQTIAGEFRYESGCIDKRKCANDPPNDCLECCQDDFCNSHGCNGEGLPPRESRGPMCYDCQHVSSMAECHTVRLCYPHQVCGVEKYTWGGIYDHYSARCYDKQCTITKRSLPDCLKCCDDDFCNTDCNYEPSNMPLIVG